MSVKESYAGKINRKLNKKLRVIAVAAGREPADLVLKNATYVNVFSNELYLGRDDADMIRGKRILLMDDVISTGGSIHAMEELVKLAGGIVAGRVSVLAEGDAAARKDIKFLAPLPVFNADGSVK